MSISNDTPMKRRPTHPGEILREDFMPDYDLTVSGLAEALGVSRQTIISLENGKYNPSILLAHSIAQLFGERIEDIFVFEEEEA